MSFNSRSFLPIRIKEVRFDRVHGKPGVLSLRTNREQTISSLSLLGSQELRSSVVSVLLSLIPGTPSIAGLYRINRMFEQRVPIQSSLCRTHGLSRYCSTSGFGPRSPWRVSNDSPNKCARSTLLISIVFRCLYGECAVQDDLPSFFLLSFFFESERKQPKKAPCRKTTRIERRPTQQVPCSMRSNSYLPDEGLHRDHVGGGPRARPGHCTSAGLTPAIIPNADNSVV